MEEWVKVTGQTDRVYLRLTLFTFLALILIMTLLVGGDSSVSIKEMENKKHNPTSTAAAGNQCFGLRIDASKRGMWERVNQLNTEVDNSVNRKNSQRQKGPKCLKDTTEKAK